MLWYCLFSVAYAFRDLFVIPVYSTLRLLAQSDTGHI